MPPITIDGHTIKYGIIGNPVSHSLSPKMHTQAFQEININAVYLPFEISETQLPDILKAFKITNVMGFNVTVPYKEKIIPFLDHVSKEAEALQSVNTVKYINGNWYGYSTDGTGFIRSLNEININIKNKKVLLLGAGGSAWAVAYALVRDGASFLQIINRTQSKAQQLISMLQKHFPNVNYSADVKINTSEFDLLVNTTSVGMKENASPVDQKTVSLCRNVVDIIYSPSQTRLMKIAESLNIPNYNGLRMLLYQGVEAFEIWTEKKAPVEKMKETLFKSFV